MIKEGMVRRTTETSNLFCNIAAKRVEQPVKNQDQSQSALTEV